MKVASGASRSQPYCDTALPMSPSVPSGASRMTHHSAFWTSSSTEVVQRQERLRLGPELQGGGAHDRAEEDDLQDVAVHERADRVGGDDPGEEVGPRPDVLRRGSRAGVERDAAARVGQQPETEPDDDGQQGRGHEPHQGAPGQPGGVGHAAQVGDAGDDGGEDERRHGQLEQLDEQLADGGQRGGQPRDVAAARDETEGDAQHEAGEDLDPERDPLERGQQGRHARTPRDGAT